MSVVSSSYLPIEGTCVRFEEATGYVDALDVFFMLTKTTSASYRLTASKFKPGSEGIKKVRWDVMGSGRGRTAVRHDIMSKALLLMKGDKTTAAKKLARSISERFFGLDTHEPPSPDPRTVQPPKPYATARDQSTNVFIYGLFSNVHNRIMYTGRTLSPEERMKQHGYKSSKCRLVRQAFHEHGSATFSMRILMLCSLDDAKRNESMWIIKNKTMFPGGYNLAHGSTAGHVNNGCETISIDFASNFTFKDTDHERRVVTEACSDLHLEINRETNGLIEYQKQHAKSLLDDQSAKSKRLVDNEVLEDKIKRAKGLGNHDLTRELEKRFLDA